MTTITYIHHEDYENGWKKVAKNHSKTGPNSIRYFFTRFWDLWIKYGSAFLLQRQCLCDLGKL